MESLLKIVNQKFWVFKYKDHNIWPKHEFSLNDDPFDFLSHDVIYDGKNGSFAQVLKSDNGSSTEEEYLEHYGNKLSHVMTKRVTVCVEKNEDKISVKIFQYDRRRNVGVQFFKINTSCHYLTFNHKTNSLYSGHITNYHKKRKFTRSVKRNFFAESPINKLRGQLTNLLTHTFIKESENLMNISDMVNNVINTFLTEIPGVEKYGLLKDDLKLYKRFLDYGETKYPNNWDTFMTFYPQPTKKILRKHKFKYIDAIMSMSEVNGDKIKRVLHKVKSCEFNTLKFSYKIFGKNFTMSQDDEIIKQMIENSVTLHYNPSDNEIEFTNKEKQNAFNVFKIVLKGEIDFSTYADHLRFYRNLNTLENLKWKSYDYDSFMDEHYEWSEKQGFYSQGDVTRIYSDKFKEEIERPILGVGDVYLPVLLTTSKEYNMESLTQSNCVKTYIKRETSVIISLRKGEVSSNERATIEYRINYGYHGVDKLLRVQSLGRFNNRLDDTWEPYLKTLDTKVNELVINGVFELPEIEYTIGGKTYNSKLVKGSQLVYDKEYYSLEWDNPIIHMTKTYVNRVVNNHDELHLLLDEF